MSTNIIWVIAAFFFVAFVVVLVLLVRGRKHDIDISVGEKLGIIPEPGSRPKLQIKCTFTNKKGSPIIEKIQLVLNSDSQLVAHQFIQDFGSAYVGAKSHVAPIKVEEEAHEGIEFGIAGQVAAKWKSGNNLLLMKVWLRPNATEHSPSKMYKIEFHLDDHVLANLSNESVAEQVLYANVVKLEQVYPSLSFKLQQKFNTN
ncbi:hypothetical protein ACFL0L_02635 [Patescibacteria group bacterium]